MASEKFKIVKGTKPPEGRNRDGVYPFAAMKPGDAFFFSAEMRPRVANAAVYHGRRHGMKFRTGKTGRPGQNESHGCWRVK